MQPSIQVTVQPLSNHMQDATIHTSYSAATLKPYAGCNTGYSAATLKPYAGCKEEITAQLGLKPQGCKSAEIRYRGGEQPGIQPQDATLHKECELFRLFFQKEDMQYLLYPHTHNQLPGGKSVDSTR